MRMQSHQNLCGPAAIANAGRARGRPMTEDKVLASIKKAAQGGEPTPEQDGTSVQGLQRALRATGQTGDTWTVHDKSMAMAYLRQQLLTGNTVLLAVDWDGDLAGHWVVAIGLLGHRFLVADSADSEIVVSYTETGLAGRWKSDTDPARYFGMTIVESAHRRKALPGPQ